MRRFYTTVEFDEFDSTFCAWYSADFGGVGLILWMLISLDQHLVGPATGVVHRSRPLHHNPIFWSRDRGFQTVRRLSRWNQLSRGPQSQEATVLLCYHLPLVQKSLPARDEDKGAGYRACRTTDTQDPVGIQYIKARICIADVIVGSSATTLTSSTSFLRTLSGAGRRRRRTMSQFTPPRRRTSGTRSLLAPSGHWILSSLTGVLRKISCLMLAPSSGADLGTQNVASLSEEAIFS